ncbi:hypothetical protein KFK09_014690 [Dendrobium nobile]|uniref:Reverse transcriptase zinc-binding domain-containing protein n=1 Tax=Dendrobium nobile TaxID=94219 RepID=A0A8T3B4N0_DENNO|nr:hypothetical protein KFK09_014690 [Dendrobium nobile]
MAVVGGLKTAYELLKRNISVLSTCGLCYSAPKSTSHLFFECPYSFFVINYFMPTTSGFLLRPNMLQLLDWIETTYYHSRADKKFKLLIACSSIYYIWRERNDRRFGCSSHNHITTILAIKRMVFEKVSKWKNSTSLLELL